MLKDARPAGLLKTDVSLGGKKQVGCACFYFKQNESMLKTARVEQRSKTMFAT